MYITKILRAERQEECERACLESRDFNCRSFNFRPYFSAENCELSQYDSKQLKLDNPAHFEQQTQFDYFEKDTSMVPGIPGMIPGGPGMYNAMADCLEVAQTCTPDGMEFTVKLRKDFTEEFTRTASTIPVSTTGMVVPCPFFGSRVRTGSQGVVRNSMVTP